MAGDKLSIFVTKQGLYQRPMVVPSDWNVGQVVQQAIADRRLTGSWELRFGGDTLSEDTALRDSGICTESQVDLVPQFQWDLASLEDKQPVFKITFENPEFERQYGVNKLDLFVQYVRGQDIDVSLDQCDRKMVEFRILVASVEKNDFILFDAENTKVRVWAEDLILLPAGTSLFSPTQMDMVYLKLLLRNFLQFTQNLYFPIFDTELNDVMLPFHQPLPLFFYRRRRGCLLAKDSLVTFEEAVFGSDTVPDARKMEEQDFYNAGWAIRSWGELDTNLRLANGIPSRITVQIDAFHYYPSRKQKEDDHRVEKFNIESLQADLGMEHWKLPIKFRLEIRPGATFESFMRKLRSNILNNMMVKLPSDWRRDEFRADKLEDIFLSVTPGTESETLQELQRETIGLELKRDEKISTWRCGNAAFYLRPDNRKEFVRIAFSVKYLYSVKGSDLWENRITVEDAPQASIHADTAVSTENVEVIEAPDSLVNLRQSERIDFVNVGSAAKKEATLDELVALLPEPSISSDPMVSMKDEEAIKAPVAVSQRQPARVRRRLVRSSLNPVQDDAKAQEAPIGSAGSFDLHTDSAVSMEDVRVQVAEAVPEGPRRVSSCRCRRRTCSSEEEVG